MLRGITIADDGVVSAGPSTEKAAALLALHRGRGFVLPNAWDAGSARILEQVGFPAIATTSAGIAWSCGIPDGGALARDTMLEHVARIVAAVGVPVTADLEAGYGDTADDVGRTVARAVEVGAVGANLEDAADGRLFGIDAAAGRIAAARAAAPSGTFVLNARTDTYFAGTAGDAFAETVQRAVRYLEAGADCVFVPGVAEGDTIRRLAAAIPGPLNVVTGLANTIDAPTLFSLGVKRSAWAGAWPGPRSAWWNAPAKSCSTPERSGFSTARSATQTCSDASACDQGARPGGEAGSHRMAARPERGIMWVIFDHLRPPGHIMPDHAGDRGAVLPVLAPHDHLHINQLRMFPGDTTRYNYAARRLAVVHVYSSPSHLGEPRPPGSASKGWRAIGLR